MPDDRPTATQKTELERKADTVIGVGCLGAALGGMLAFGVGGIVAAPMLSPLAALIVAPCAGIVGIVAGTTAGAYIGHRITRKGS